MVKTLGLRWPFGGEKASDHGGDDYQAGPDASALQVAALPYRLVRRGELQILIITSRNSERWVIPKGWPVKGLTLCQSAAREAFEEAGVKGAVGPHEIGRITYVKASSGAQPTERLLVVYPLHVRTKLSAWPESATRRRRWVSRAEAAEVISIADLTPLIRNFDPAKSAKPK